jgi:hypothetical protein
MRSAFFKVQSGPETNRFALRQEQYNRPGTRLPAGKNFGKIVVATN